MRSFVSRFIAVTMLTMIVTSACAAERTYPLWDGSESVADYAKRVILPPTKTLELGDGIKMELVLIPAGTFKMGTPEPQLDEAEYYTKIVIAKWLLATGSGMLLVLVGTILVRALRSRGRLKFSLARLVAMTATMAFAVMGATQWRQSADDLKKAREDYQASRVRCTVAAGDEKPAHLVTLSRPFYMGRFPVTQEQYQHVMDANPSSSVKGKDNPVENLLWDDAQEFCRRLSAETSTTIRLPTEAEWEFACRAGSSTTYHSGDTEKDLYQVAWYLGNSGSTTHPVGQKEPNVFGLYDMHGNVWQWCQDWYSADYYANSPIKDPENSNQTDRHVLRGGNWAFNPFHCRSAVRLSYPTSAHFDVVGFRVVSPLVSAE